MENRESFSKLPLAEALAILRLNKALAMIASLISGNGSSGFELAEKSNDIEHFDLLETITNVGNDEVFTSRRFFCIMKSEKYA
ncbi:MAG TPA: hypothetical protein DCO86_01585 [Spirochaetaceae bacterium]|nr:hypothetical protein [Spirochaetaceae bacterium]